MPFVMKWQSGEVVLEPQSPETQLPAAPAPLKITLDFTLSPLTFVSEDDRHRLLTVLVDLRQKSGAEEPLVDLQIPTVWGVNLHLPDPLLSESELAVHLRWEVSKAVLDSADHYRYTHAAAADGTLILGAIRTSLYDHLIRLFQEAGYKLQGLYFDEDLYAGLDLARAPIARPFASVEATTPEEEPVIIKRRRRPEKEGTSPQRWFLPALIVVGIGLIALFVWMKTTSDRRPSQTTSPPPAMTERGASTEAASDSLSRISSDVSKSDTPQIDSARPAVMPEAGTLGTPPATYVPAGMSPRLDLVQRLFSEPVVLEKFSLISFTADRFLCQFEAPDSTTLDSVFVRVKTQPHLSGTNLKQVTAGGGLYQGTITGHFRLDEAQQKLSVPDSARVIALAQKRGLQHRALVFTGSQPATFGFLQDLTSENLAIYRLILLPWNNQEYRTVIDF